MADLSAEWLTEPTELAALGGECEDGYCGAAHGRRMITDAAGLPRK